MHAIDFRLPLGGVSGPPVARWFFCEAFPSGGPQCLRALTQTKTRTSLSLKRVFADSALGCFMLPTETVWLIRPLEPLSFDLFGGLPSIACVFFHAIAAFCILPLSPPFAAVASTDGSCFLEAEAVAVSRLRGCQLALLLLLGT